MNFTPKCADCTENADTCNQPKCVIRTDRAVFSLLEPSTSQPDTSGWDCTSPILP